MNIFPLLLQLFSGLVGGNIAGAASRRLEVGPLGSSLAGIVGGGLGGQFYEHLSRADNLAATDVSIFMASVAGGSIGGALAVILIGWVKSLLGRN